MIENLWNVLFSLKSKLAYLDGFAGQIRIYEFYIPCAFASFHTKKREYSFIVAHFAQSKL
ncbi:MAG: hypothetical protein OEW75_07535 [Cyclobacteriaceae bacterium]|nr:hypothetical protein [Cyclobacteriaceae bacterium]